MGNFFGVQNVVITSEWYQSLCIIYPEMPELAYITRRLAFNGNNWLLEPCCDRGEFEIIKSNGVQLIDDCDIRPATKDDFRRYKITAPDYIPN